MNKEELDKWVEDSHYYEHDECVVLLRQLQAENKDLKQQVAFLEDWKSTWLPYIKEAQEK